MLTLVGPGGSGKTRLALQAAQNLVESPVGETTFSHNVFFVPLEAVSSPDFLVSAIAEALDFAFYRDVTPKQQLLDYLRQKSTLLILDNFEHLLPAVDLVTDILATAPEVTIIVTSRESLNLQGEWLFPVDGLPFPESEETEVASLEEYQAIQLFVQCARRARPGFSLSVAKDSVVRICQLVEGMPLGIELAAAWLKLFPGHKIAQEIERSLDFLTTSQRNVPARHRSMRAVFGHSWQLLSEAERSVLRRLAVFQGGFRQEAAEQVAGASLSILMALVEKALLRLTPGERYQMHELLRQFVEEKLRATPLEQERTQDRHRDYYLTFLRQQEEKLKGAQQQAVLGQISAEIENIQAGWNLAVAQGKIDRLDQALESLYNFYSMRSWFWEGMEAFERAAQRLQESTLQSQSETEIPSAKIVLGKVLARQGAFSEALGLYESAHTLLQQSLALARRLNVRREIAFVLNMLGNVVGQQGKFSEAKQRYQESLTIGQELGNQAEVAYSLYGLGWVAQEQGAYPEAKQLYQESLMISREIGHQDLIAYSLDRLGVIAYILGEYREAEQYYQESLAISNEIGNRVNQAMALGGLGWAAWGLGGARLAGAAKSSIEESLAICREIGHRSHTGGRLIMLGEVANSLEEYEEAQQACGKALAIFQEIGHSKIGFALAGLGEAACGRGDFQAARKYLSEALKVTMNTQSFPVALYVLSIWAILLVKEGGFHRKSRPARERKKKRALELLALTMHHPVTWQIYKDRSAHLLAKLKAELPPKVVASALERGKARDLAATVAELLAEAESQ